MTNKIKPFAIDCTDLTEEQVAEIISKSLEAGAEEYDTLAGYAYDSFPYWGVDDDACTYVNDELDMFGDDVVLITFDQLDEHLGLVKDVAISGDVDTSSMVEENAQRTNFDNTKWDQSDWSEEQKRQWQEKCFELGYSWNTSKEVSCLNSNYFFLYRHQEITKSSYFQTFERKTFTEQTWSDMFPEEEQPKHTSERFSDAMSEAFELAKGDCTTEEENLSKALSEPSKARPNILHGTSLVLEEVSAIIEAQDLIVEVIFDSATKRLMYTIYTEDEKEFKVTNLEEFLEITSALEILKKFEE